MSGTIADVTRRATVRSGRPEPRATIVAAASWPVTFAVVRNMSGNRVDAEQNAEALDGKPDARQHRHHRDDRTAGNAGNAETRNDRRDDDRHELRAADRNAVQVRDEHGSRREAERRADAKRRRRQRNEEAADLLGQTEPVSRAVDQRRQRRERRPRRDRDGLRRRRGAREARTDTPPNSAAAG